MEDARGRLEKLKRHGETAARGEFDHIGAREVWEALPTLLAKLQGARADANTNAEAYARLGAEYDAVVARMTTAEAERDALKAQRDAQAEDPAPEQAQPANSQTNSPPPASTTPSGGPDASAAPAHAG